MPSFLALGALLGIALLALFPDGTLLPPQARLSEKSALIFLLATFLIALIPKFQRQLLAQRDAATWALMAAMFVLFHIAERAGPREGWSLRFAALPDDAFALSYALRLAVLGAIISFPAWTKGGGPHRAMWAALLFVGVLGFGTFGFLAQFFSVGVTETLDPTPLPTLGTQILGYGAVAALCRAVTSSDKATRLILRAMPLILIVVWAKMQFGAVPVAVEDAE